MSYCVTTVGAVLKAIVSGKSIRTLERPAQQNEFGILKVSAVTWGEFRPAESKAMPLEYDPGECPRAMDGDILISRANTRELVGAPVMVHGDHPRLLLSDKLLKLIPDETAVDSRYLVRALRSAGAALHFSQCAGGSSGSMTNITQGDIRSAPLPLPPLPEQRRIAAILDQADALRAKRQEALAQLDSLTQSIFIEMFGDPAANPKGWEAATLGDLIFSATDGPHVSPSYSETGIPFLSTRHVRRGEISWSDLKFLSPADAEVQWKKCRPERGDILYTKGGTTGLAAAVRTEEAFAVWVHVALLKPDSAKVETEWLESMLNADFCYRQSQDLTHGIANRDLGLKRMVKIRMYRPPSSLQREFVERKERVNALRASSYLALAELDALFASLQHRAFSGGL